MEIENRHREEWLLSAVSPEIIELNVQSLFGTLPYEYLLYGLDNNHRRNDGRLRDRWLNRYQHLDKGGWWCSGTNILNGSQSEWGCFKPDFPYADAHSKKTIKYEHPPQVKTEVFALCVPQSIASSIADKACLTYTDFPFWDWVKRAAKLPILITEGAKKAGALLTANYCAIALPGINGGYRSEDNSLIPQLLELVKVKREFIFCFDQDRRYKTKQNVIQATLKTGKLLAETGAKISVLEWDYSLGKGVDDLIVNKGREFFDHILENRLSLADYEQARTKKTEYLESGRLLDFMRGEFEAQLSWDSLRYRILLDRNPIQLNESLRFWFIDKFHYKTSKEDLFEVMTYLAKSQSFNPVERYLNDCYVKSPRIPIDNLATRYFHTDNELYDIFVKRFLIGCVARCFSPGCKLDTALILQGHQGIKKSTFFDVLGGEWFDDSLGDINHKDALLLLHRCWIQELGEFERITSKKAAGEIKAFLSRRSDTFREPYAREAIEHPRRSVLCGSVNKSNFLLDETGNRRFWIIPIAESVQKIDTEVLKQERDAIWGMAVDAYFAGEQWWLTEMEETLSSANNLDFEVADTWETEIEQFLEGRERVSVAEILSDLFHFVVVEHDRPLQTRVTSILRKLGWDNKQRTMHQGKRQIVWEPCHKICEKVEKGSIRDFGMAEVAEVAAPQKSSTSVLPSHKNAIPAIPAIQKSRIDPFVKNSQNLQPGQQVIYQRKTYRVRAATAFMVELHGLNKYVQPWECQLVEEEDAISR